MKLRSLADASRDVAFRACWHTAAVVERTATAAASGAHGLSTSLTTAAVRVRDARRLRLRLRLFCLELAGTVLVTYGIALWCIPAALIIGGLVLVATVEVRPHAVPLPDVPPPDDLIRAQAEQVARQINAQRYGVGAVDEAVLGRLSRSECVRLVSAAYAEAANAS